MWKEFWAAALDLVFPPRRVCPLCGGFSPGAAICAGCRELLADYAAEPVCRLCGRYAGPGRPGRVSGDAGFAVTPGKEPGVVHRKLDGGSDKEATGDAYREESGERTGDTLREAPWVANRAATGERAGETIRDAPRAASRETAGVAFGTSSGLLPGHTSRLALEPEPGMVQPTVAKCADCRRGRPFVAARAVGPYEGPLREAVHRLKYRRARHQARPMAALMARVFTREPAFAGSRGLVPVPLHPARERRRGFNQAALLARFLAESTGVPLLEGAVARVRETPPQTSLPRHERLGNLVGAFRVKAPELVKDRNITIVDDVLTTGSTVSNLSQELRQAGAVGITVLTFAAARQTGKY